MAGEVVVELEHWVHPRLPLGHVLSERWTLSSSGRAVLTFGTEIEARAVLAAHEPAQLTLEEAV